jgi:activator of 2-hydroxyglutaryl-CoA dehydratase
MAEKGVYVHSKYIKYNNFANMSDTIVEIGSQDTQVKNVWDPLF